MNKQQNNTTRNNMRTNHQPSYQDKTSSATNLNNQAAPSCQQVDQSQVVAQPISQPTNKTSLLLTVALVPAFALLVALANYSITSATIKATNKINLKQRIVDCNKYSKFENAKGNTNNSVCPAFPPTIDNKDANNNKLIVEGVYDKEHTTKFTVVFDDKTYTLGENSELTSNGNYWQLKLPKLPAPGEYTVTATSTIADGKELTVTDEVVITVTAPPVVITPDEPKEDPEQPEEKPVPSVIDNLTSTGANIYLIAGAAAILILASIVLIIVKSKKKK